ncbi:hypothetical protein LINPERPRIM_LOCUS22606, partial [Linum perenne]
YHRVLLQLDSRAADRILTKEGDVTHQHAREVIYFMELLNRDWIVNVRNIYREDNQTTYYLANLGYDPSPRLHLIPCSNASLSRILFYDSL